VIVLGIADNHDAGAALALDGRLAAAVGQERLDRVKNSAAFPWEAMEAVLRVGGVEARDVDVVALGTAFTPTTALRLLPRLHAERRAEGNFSYLLNLYVAYQVAARRTGLHRAEAAASAALVRRRLAARGYGRARLVLVDHHEAHAHAAYRTQASDPCTVLTLDAMGDGLTATAWTGRDGRLERVWAQSGFAAVNTFYSRITEFLGFRPNRHEGKITGLAAFAPAPPELAAHLRGLLRFEDGRFSRENYLVPQRRDDRFHRVLARFTREEVAAAAQAVLEEAACAWVRATVERTGLGSLAVAGGTFANVALNRRIAGLDAVDRLWVCPNMGDGGLPVGAALATSGAAPARLDHVYLGPSVGEAEAAAALAGSGLAWERPADPAGRAADLLAAGRVVARCAGGMEWGPRALGNRTILYRPDDRSVNDWLNRRLQRTEFMPFAPVTRVEDAPALYRGLAKAPDAARFMTVCFEATDALRRDGPGVVHVDGTARPQVLAREENPEVYAILEAFRARTGIGTLINTSFNLHEEPIACTASDALRAWREADLHALLLGPFLVEAPARR